MQDEENIHARRGFLKAAAGTGHAALSGMAGAQSFDFKPYQRYPDPAVLILDPGFAKYRPGTAARWSRWARACAGPKGRCTSRRAATCWSATYRTTA